jgi:hypothetical protein
MTIQYMYNQFCGIGSGCFWTSRKKKDLDPTLCVRNRILPSSSKKVRTTLISTVFLLLYDFLSLKNDVSAPSKRNKHKKFKTYRKKIFFVAVLKVNDEKSQVPTDPRIRIRTKISHIPSTGHK